MQRVNYHNGNQVDVSAVHVHAFGPLALWGEGCFDTFRVSGGHVLFQPQHEQRLRQGIDALWGDRQDIQEQLQGAWHFIQRHAPEFVHGRGRILVAPVDPGREQFDVFAEIVAFTPMTLHEYALGVHAGFSDYAHPGYGSWGKSTSAIWSRMAAEEARARGFDEVILCRDEIVVEAAWSALLWREGGHWRTPAASLKPLPSTTLAALRDTGLEVEEVVATRERLSYADAIVLLSAVRLAIGVCRLEERTFSEPDRAAAPLRDLLLRV